MLGLVITICAVIAIQDCYENLSDPQSVAAFKKQVSDELFAVDGWEINFKEPEDTKGWENSSRDWEPYEFSQGEYLEIVNGPYALDFDNNDSDADNIDSDLRLHDGFLRIPAPEREKHSYGDDMYDWLARAHNGEIPIPGLNKGSRGAIRYQRRDNAQYMVIVRAYSERKRSQEVQAWEKYVGGGAGPLHAATLTAKVPNVLVTVVERRSQRIVARRDFSDPEKWINPVEGLVFCEKLGRVDEWLTGLGLRMNHWLYRVAAAQP
jgi:hypothetical protein